MNKITKLLKKLIRFGRDNYIVSLIGVILVLVGLFILIKSLASDKQDLYVKVKVSQGLWWANAAKPSYWIVKSLQKGLTEKSVTGKTVAELLEVRAYPSGAFNTEQYDTYLTLRLLVDYQPNTQRYVFKRNTVAVGSPIDLEFPEIQVSATVYDISTTPFHDSYETKIVTFRKDFVKKWEFDNIQQGDKYMDGTEVMLEILDKNYEETYSNIESIVNTYPIETTDIVNITIKAKMKLQKKGDVFFYKEEIPIQKGRPLNFQTASLYFDQYRVVGIE